MISPLSANHIHFKYWYDSGNASIAYNTIEEIATFLLAHTEIGIYEYSESMIKLANVHAAWGDYKGMRETFNFLVDVRIRLAELREERHLS